MLFREAFEENLDRHWTYTWLEVIQSEFVDAHPVRNILGICQSCGQTNKPDIVSCLLRNISHTTDDYLDYWPSFLSKQMDLINDHQSNSRHIAPMLPVSADSIPLLWRGDEYIRLLQSLEVWSHITSELKHRLSKLSLFQPLFPIDDSLLGQRLQRCNENDFALRCVFEHSQHCQLCHNCLA